MTFLSEIVKCESSSDVLDDFSVANYWKRIIIRQQ